MLGYRAAVCEHALQALCRLRAASTGSVQQGGCYDARRSAAALQGGCDRGQGQWRRRRRALPQHGCVLMHLPAVRLSDHPVTRHSTAARLQHGVRLTASPGVHLRAEISNHSVQGEPFDLLARGPLYSSFSIGFFTAGDKDDRAS